MERETGIEPATNSLEVCTRFENKEHMRRRRRTLATQATEFSIRWLLKPTSLSCGSAALSDLSVLRGSAVK
jgi:hypothetical protein